MQIYKLSGNDNLPECAGKTKSDEEALSWFHPLLGKPLPSISEWVPTTLVPSSSEASKNKNWTYSSMLTSTPLFFLSSSSVELLNPFLNGQIDLYPVTFEDDLSQKYFMLKVNNELPAESLDREHSIGDPVKYGPKANLGLLSPIYNWKFREELVKGHDIFTLPDSNTTIYVSSRFKDAVLESGLTGFCFKHEYIDENPILT
ncbi:imm11 family protein [Reinekea marinisedimentorum]|uniref:Immunity MXAN-0049 protein domain-containing protein n=1 Tax=Reinekea marinisedimentorum TaxID=230495 RepID=A0A4R3HQW2_9GAMM|nr:DUF1629 domain-containing protein [Reinekea marinisedimentorum]TCS34399.1 hypothetical protein BCF53_1433 [Reinekea marinisedimentorum]